MGQTSPAPAPPPPREGQTANCRPLGGAGGLALCPGKGLGWPPPAALSTAQHALPGAPAAFESLPRGSTRLCPPWAGLADAREGGVSILLGAGLALTLLLPPLLA